MESRSELRSSECRRRGTLLYLCSHTSAFGPGTLPLSIRQPTGWHGRHTAVHSRNRACPTIHATRTTTRPPGLSASAASAARRTTQSFRRRAASAATAVSARPHDLQDSASRIRHRRIPLSETLVAVVAADNRTPSGPILSLADGLHDEYQATPGEGIRAAFEATVRIGASAHDAALGATSGSVPSPLLPLQRRTDTHPDQSGHDRITRGRWMHPIYT